MSHAIVEQAVALLRARYVFPDRAEAAATAIEAHLAAGDYDGLDEVTLGERLTEQMFAVCADKHLRVRPRAAQLHDSMDPETEDAVWAQEQRLSNYKISRVERLEGNIGYLDLRGVTEPDVGGDAIAAAMRLVAHTHALIIDLRRNRGGSPDGVVFWCSYLFPDGSTHLNSIFDAESGNTKQFWSLAYVPGDRYLDRPVYVLTSDVTFSGGEEFAYNLKALKRATLIGETTRGGAHPTSFIAITPTVEITVPVARSINPVTGTNWEGTGVEPDIAVPAERAYDHAYRAALEHVLTVATTLSILDEARTALAALDTDRRST